MNRALLLFAALVATFAISCGGDKKDDGGDSGSKPSSAAAADEGSNEGDPFDDDRDVVVDDEADEEASGAGFLSPLFNLGLGGATGGGPSSLPGVQMGSGDLEQYLLTAADIPAGYTNSGPFSMKLPADVANDFPASEVAASMWTSSELQSSEFPTGGSMLMVMVVRPDDPSAVEEFADQMKAFGEDDILDSFGADGSTFGVEIKDVEQLDSTGLGDQASGIALTMDMSGFFEGLAEGFGDELDEEMPPELLDVFSAFKMRMRFFGEGDKIGAVMQIGFGADADLADDLALAQRLRSNLQ